ncbi:LTA synthase family protein [Clostridium sp. AM58-1XD]|uniref:LTA synthase family protein n=1 Tax=Clostridium sp. AM58-1XD TaxID=2292307 RepID=UPI000E4D42B9|nr:LTA synthase family protein [Clostridium sp. AM58-1XD]RGY98105.1 LTA synthase family protein [Clostridium sp. AM58-1XD]
MKYLKEWSCICRREVSALRAAKLLMLILTPVTAFYLMQFIYGGYPWMYSLPVVAGNAACIAAVYYIFGALTGGIAWTSVLIHVLAGLLGAANYYVKVFRGTPILPWDMTAFRTAAAVSGSYRLFLTWQMAAGIFLTAAAAVLLYRWSKDRKLSIKKKRYRLILLAAGILCLEPVMNPGILEKMGISTDVWNQAEAYRKMGVLAEFLCNTRFMEVEKPEGYSAEAYETLMSPLGENGIRQLTGEYGSVPASSDDLITDHTQKAIDKNADFRPHIIAIMNESWADFEEFGNLSLNRSPMDKINSLKGIHGTAYTSVFGSGTSASEFEFLTGNTMAFLPSGSIPYQQYILRPSPSLASFLKEKGYSTTAIHPGERTSWQRDKAYPLLGFDTFKCAEDMDVKKTEEHGYISDQSSFDQIIYEYEHRKQGEKMFLFNVTIQNHGSYTADYPTEVYLTDMPGAYPMAEQYLTLEDKTDEAFAKLAAYFEKQEEPVLIVMFGDHQPSLEQGFFDMAYGVEQKDMTMEQYMGKFRVPYVIWANYELPEQGADELMSLNFLSQFLLKCAGMEEGWYGNFIEEFRKEIPALTFSGYFGSDGKAYSHMETNGYGKIMEKYKIAQYGTLFSQ